MEAVEPVDGGLEGEFAAGDLQLLDEVGGPGEQDPCSVVDQGRPMAAARWLFRRRVGRTGEQLAPLANQLSPAVMAMTCALESIGAVSKSKVSRVFPGGERLGEDGVRSAGGPVRRVRVRRWRRGSVRRAILPCPPVQRPATTSLMAGRRNSLSRRLMRALSTAWVVFMPPLLMARPRRSS